MVNKVLNSRIKFRHIFCFLEVAKLSSVANAASVLGVSQPAVSKTIAELEELLGVELFDRSRRSLSLTHFGEIFLRYAGASVSALHQGIDSIGRSGAQAAIVRVGALPSVSAHILPRAVSELAGKGLGSRTRIITGSNDHLLSLLRLGEVDLVVGRMADPEAMTGFSFEKLYSEQVAFVVRPGHPLLDEAAFDFQMLRDYPILMPPPGSIIRPIVDRFMVANGFGPVSDELQTVSGAFGRSFVRMSDCVWVISEGVVAEDIEDGVLIALPIDSRPTSGPVGLTTRTDTTHSLPAEFMMDAIRRVASHYADDDEVIPLRAGASR